MHNIYEKKLYKKLNTFTMENKKYKRKKSLKKTFDAIKKIKNSVPSIIFKANNLVVTLKNESQLEKWIKIYPEGTYTINS